MREQLTRACVVDPALPAQNKSGESRPLVDFLGLPHEGDRESKILVLSVQKQRGELIFLADESSQLRQHALRTGFFKRRESVHFRGFVLGKVDADDGNRA